MTRPQRPKRREEKTQRVHVTLYPSDVERLRAIAERLELSTSAALARAIEALGMRENVDMRIRREVEREQLSTWNEVLP